MRNSKNSVQPEARKTAERSNRDLAPSDAVSSEALQKLREEWDTRLASLNAPDSGDRLSKIMAAPCQLDGEVIAGKTH